MHAFAMACVSSVALKQRYKQDLILEVIIFASGRGEKYVFVFGLVPKSKAAFFLQDLSEMLEFCIIC